MESSRFNAQKFLQSLRSTKPPWECPICQKTYRSYCGIEYHLLKFDHSAPPTPIQRLPPTRKSKLKFTVRKKNSRLIRRSPSPNKFLTTPRDTLTWAEAQQMVELESDGKVYRLNISDKLEIFSDSEDDVENNFEVKTLKSSPKNKNLNCNFTTNNFSELVKSESLTEKKEQICKVGRTTLLPTPLFKNVPFNSKSSNPNSYPKPSYKVLPDYEKNSLDAPPRPSAYYRFIEKPNDELEEEVEYDMDEEDSVWLELMNKYRVQDGLPPVSDAQLELLMDRFEKESYFEQTKNGHGAPTNQSLIDEDAVCCVCNDGECENSNVILFCDMCDLAIHQECYGVPYIPEGQWLCRRCLQSPSSPVECCLCPNKSGAFKQTDDGRWAHVVCALWVPEVGFGNTVFLEPIDGLKNVPSARWKLTCYICKQRNSGACIQCHRTNCYTAFHVTCAQHAGLYMKMEPVKKTGENGVTITVKQEAYCDIHTPADASPRYHRVNGKFKYDEISKNNDKMKKARKFLAEKRLEVPQISLPYIPRKRMASISRLVGIQKKAQFLQRLLSYWTLKRQSRNGVPLLRRLQSCVHPHKPLDPEMESEQKHLMEQFKYWQRLRHDLERARLLIELLRKREKLKRELVRISQVIAEYRLTPFKVLLRRTLTKLSAIDTAKVFAEPVKASDAPDYYKLIKSPMDFSTMASKIENCEYSKFSDFEDDFDLIISNCLLYNSRDTVFYRFATRLRYHGGSVIRATKREIARTGFDVDTGMLLSKTPEKHIEQVIDEETRHNLPLSEQLDIMLARLEQAVIHGRKSKKIRSEVALLKRKIARENNLAQAHSSSTNNDIINQSDDLPQSPSSLSATSNDISPKPNGFLESETTQSGKRLWTNRLSPTPFEFSVKKRILERSGSCPLSSNCSNAKSSESSNDNQFSLELVKKKTLDIRTTSVFDSRSISLPASPDRECINRRSSVLFKKKSRSPAAMKSKLIDQLNNSPSKTSPISLTSTDHNFSRIVATLTKHESNGDSSENNHYCEKSFANGHSSKINGHLEEDVTTKSEGSFQIYREDSHCSSDTVVDSDSSSSSHNEGACQVNGEKSPQSRNESTQPFCPYRSDESDDDMSSIGKPGLLLADGTDISAINNHKHSFASGSEDENQNDDLPHINPLDLVWAKCRGYPPYPALLIDPKMPRSGFCDNGVPIPVPPIDVLHAGRAKRNENSTVKIYLVLFFDTKRTWQWLPRNKLERLGVDRKADQLKLSEGRRPSMRKNVEAAYQRALLHRSKVTGDLPDSDDDDETTTKHSNNIDSL